MNITVKTSKGDTYTVEVQSEDETVETIKKKLQEEMKKTDISIKLIHTGKLLKDEVTLKEYGIKNGTTLHLLMTSTKSKAQEENKDTDKTQSEERSTAQSSAQSSAYSEAQNGAQNRMHSRSQTEEESLNNLSSFLQGTNRKKTESMPNIGATMPDIGAMNPNDPNTIKALFDNSTEEMRQGMAERIKEMMKNPEQMKMLTEMSLAMNPNMPEEQKRKARESMNMMAEMAKSNPEEFSRMIDFSMKAQSQEGIMNNLHNMHNAMNTGGSSSASSTHAGHTNGSTAHNPPHSSAMTLPYGFNRTEAVAKYAEELAMMREMGCPDENVNLLALFFSEGDMTKAMNLVLDWNKEKESK